MSGPSEPSRRVRFSAPVPRPAPAAAQSRDVPAPASAAPAPVPTGVPLFLRRAAAAPASASPASAAPASVPGGHASAGPVSAESASDSALGGSASDSALGGNASAASDSALGGNASATSDAAADGSASAASAALGGGASASALVAPADHPAEAEAERVERRVASGESAFAAVAVPPSPLPTGAADGTPLPADVRARIEPIVGADLSHVRVHTDAEAQAAARALGARAFARGSDVFLASGESAHDAPLMAHEAVHTLHPDGAVHRKPAAAPRLRDGGSARSRPRRTERASGLPRPAAAPSTDAREAEPAPASAAPQATGPGGPDAAARGEGTAPSEGRAVPPGGAPQPDATFSARGQAVMNAEVGEVVANPSISAERPPDGPTILRPSGPAAPPTLAAPPAPAAPAPAPPAAAGSAAPSPADMQAAAASAAPADAAPALAAPAAPSAGGGAAPAPAAPPPAMADAAAAVPPPAPAELRGQLPDRTPSREEFDALMASGVTPEQSRERVGALAAQLRADAETARAGLRAEAENHRGALLAEAESRAAEALAAAESEASAVSAHCASTRSALTAEATSRAEQVRAAVEADVARIHAGTDERIAAATAELARRQADITAYALAEQARPREIATAEADRADGVLERNAVEAEQAGESEAGRHPGSDDPRPDQRAAAREVGRASAADIRDKKPALRADLLERTDGFSGRYTELSDAVVAQVADAADQLVPGLQDAAARAEDAVRAGGDAALAGLETRLQADLAALDAAEQESTGRIRAGGASAAERLRASGAQGAAEVDTILDGVLASIDAGVEEAAAVVEGESAPFLPGMEDVVAGARGGVESTIAAGREQLSAGAAQGMAALAASAAAAAEQARALGDAGRAAADGVRDAALPALAQTAERRQQDADGALAALAAEQESVVTGVMAEVDRALEQARGEIARINEQLRDELHAAAEESIGQAVLPRTDDTETRAAAAAAQQEESWYVGLWRAAVELAKGLIIMVVVALVVAAIAAAFGVLLTAWTAVMIAGAVLLAFGLVMSIIHRSGQRELGGNPLLVVGVAVLDVTGLTGIYEGIRGRDLVTGRDLNDAEQTQRGVLGVFTAVTLVLGVRAFRAGPPGGAYVRPGSIPFSWRTIISTPFRQTAGRVGGFLKEFGVGLYEVVTTGASRLYESVRARLGMEPSAGLKERLGEPSRVGTDRPHEMPYERPESARVVTPDAPLDVTQLDPSQSYLWVADAQGRMHVVPEGMRWNGRRYVAEPEINPGHGTRNAETPGGRPVKHGDVVPGPEGAYRGEARAGGELRAERGPDGNPTGRWIMNNESSYTVQRQNVTPATPTTPEVRTPTPELGGESLAAAIEVLRANGTDVSNIVPRNSWGADRPNLPPAPAEAPPLPPVVMPVPGAGQRNPEEAHASTP